MSDAPYNAVVKDHFSAPRKTPCHPPGRNIVFATAGEESAGARYRLSAKLLSGGLHEIRFEAFGCPHSIAAASLLSEELRGRSLEKATEWNWRAVSRVLALPAEKRGRLLILEDALRSLIAAARDLQGLDDGMQHPHPCDSPTVHSAVPRPT